MIADQWPRWMKEDELARHSAVYGVRAAESLVGLLPGERRNFTIASGGTAPTLTLESDRLIPGQRIGFESRLNP